MDPTDDTTALLKRQAENDGRSSRKDAKQANHAHDHPVRPPSFAEINTQAPNLAEVSQAVFNTTELLEQILLCLPMKSVFVSQRVCTHFKDTILKSNALQQKLFLRPAGDKSVLWLIRPSIPRGQLQEKFAKAPADVHFRVANASEVMDGTVRRYRPAALNPLLRLDTDIPAHDREAACRVWSRVGDRLALDLKIKIGIAHSWRDMYLTDPPCESINLAASWFVGLPDTPDVEICSTVTAVLQDTDGLTLGALVDAVVHKKRMTSSWNDSEWTSLDNTSLNDVLLFLGDSKQQEAMVVEFAAYPELEGVVIADEKEWQEMASSRNAVQHATSER
ncbi:hypothetical protein LTR37_018998 [Vermiconidia calcicola]|uniref:Uncharacterized protein n=1 Tax=Vermiconidia calcicola TaxID=1690605 RepID=A0ACC3MFI0_9PEZI|nr:hypothetical protein LTR37_018998 [Vermiconidia calcicola]